MPVIDGVLLAAGYSVRMGEFKPLMKQDGRPYVVEIARKLGLVCRRVIVVLGHRSGDIRAAFAAQTSVESLVFIENPHFDQGMFTSLQVGIAALTDADWALYHFSDQPHLPDEFYAEFTRSVQDGFNCVQPVYHGRKGHPLLLNRSLFAAVQGSPSDGTLRDLLTGSRTRVKMWDCSYPEILQDFDTRADIK